MFVTLRLPSRCNPQPENSTCPEAPEQKAREKIDARLEAYARRTHEFASMNIHAGADVAVHEYPLTWQGAHDRTRRAWSPENNGGRWNGFEYHELTTRDKLNIDLVWLLDSPPEDSKIPPAPEVSATKIAHAPHPAIVAPAMTPRGVRVEPSALV